MAWRGNLPSFYSKESRQGRNFHFGILGVKRGQTRVKVDLSRGTQSAVSKSPLIVSETDVGFLSRYAGHRGSPKTNVFG